MLDFDSIVSTAEGEGITSFNRASEADGIHAITGFELDQTVTDKEGKASILISTANGHIRVYQNSQDITLSVILGLAKKRIVPYIAYFHEPREDRNGTWLRVRAGEKNDPKLEEHMAGKGRASRTLGTAVTTDKPVEQPVAQPVGEDLPF